MFKISEGSHDPYPHRPVYYKYDLIFSQVTTVRRMYLTVEDGWTKLLDCKDLVVDSSFTLQ